MNNRDAAPSRLAPGSPEAVDAGCRCPVLDNARGRGYLGGVKSSDGSTVYVYSGDCPLHGSWLREKEETR